MVRIQGGQKSRKRVTNTCSAAAEHTATINNPVPFGAPSAWSTREEIALSMSITPNKPFETDLRKRASPAYSAALWRRWAS